MAPNNRALWLKTKQDPVMVVDLAPYPVPGPKELVIKTTTVAINPADWIIQRAGVLLTSFPAILGCDAAGIVQAVGSDLADRFKPGERVFGATSCLVDYRYSGFQEYVVLKEPFLARIPDIADFTQAVVLPLGIWTASTCLFAKENLDLALPGSGNGQGKTLLIWGASSSIGCCATQLAVTAGYEVIAIASVRNHDMLKTLGATSCFDYNSEDVVKTIAKHLDGKTVVGAFDCISKEETIQSLCGILDAARATRRIIAAVQPGADAMSSHGVEVRVNFAVDAGVFEATIGTHIWKESLPSALEEGRFQYKPDPEIVGHGLEEVQKAVDLLAKGVSAKKLVVTI